MLALTATATVEVQDDIVQQLGCHDMERFVAGFDRPNLTYRVLHLKGPQAKLTLGLAGTKTVGGLCTGGRSC